MKRSNAIIRLCATLLVFIAQSASAGDLLSLRVPPLEAFLTSGKLNQIVAKFVPLIDETQEADPKVRALWSMMKDNGLVQDLVNSKYVVLKGGCLVGSDPRTAASTEIPSQNDATHPWPNHADVCWDPTKFVDNRSNLLDLVVFSLHEEAHHFGMDEDGAYAITKMVTPLLHSLDMSPEDNAFVGILLSQGSGQTQEDGELLCSIKKGSQITVLQDLSSQGQPTFYHGSVHPNQGDMPQGPYCFLQGVMYPGEKYKLASSPICGGSGNDVAGTPTDVTLYLDGPNGQDPLLICARNPDDGQALSVGDFLEATSGFFTLDTK